MNKSNATAIVGVAFAAAFTIVGTRFVSAWRDVASTKARLGR